MSHPNGDPAPIFPAAQPFPTQPAGVPVEPATVATTPVEPTPTAAFPVAGPTPPGMAPVASPVSAPAYPVSAPAYPFSAIPLGFEQPKPKRTGTILLTVATIVLAVIAAGMTTLFFVEHTQRANADNKVSEQTAALTAEQTKSKDLQTQLDTSKSTISQLNQDLEGEKNKTADVQKQKDALAACLKAFDDYGRSQTSANRTKLVTACNEAYKYI